MRTSVIVSTYNNPSALEKTLWGLCSQTTRDFEVLIADDGSMRPTRELIHRFQDASPLEITHVWHEDRGFRKGKILNRAIVRAIGDYLIFLDGDCIPREDFVVAHSQLARPNFFISGGSHIDIPLAVHSQIRWADVVSQQVFQPEWLAARGMAARRYRYRLTRKARLARWLDVLTPRPGVFVGANASAWKRDILSVNGFDETCSHGSDDKDLGVRLRNLGVASRRFKYSLVCVHLAHARPYSSRAQVVANKRRLRQVCAWRVTETANGIAQAVDDEAWTTRGQPLAAQNW